VLYVTGDFSALFGLTLHVETMIVQADDLGAAEKNLPGRHDPPNR